VKFVTLCWFFLQILFVVLQIFVYNLKLKKMKVVKKPSYFL